MHVVPNLPKGIASMKHLLVIGNGFDVAHGIPSRYRNFENWLRENDYDLIEHMSAYFPYVFDEDLEWWNDFENNLDMIEAHEEISRVVNDNYPDFGSDEFRDRDYHAASQEMRAEMGNLYSNIQNAFEKWIETLPRNAGGIFCLDDYDMFLTFNYTDLLQDTYKMGEDKILYIHGRSSTGEELIVGHNANPDHYVDGIRYEAPELPADLDPEDLAQWAEANSDDFMTSETRKVAEEVVVAFKKPTEDIISKYRVFFSRCNQLEEISFIGFSFADVDMPYILMLAENSSDSAVWKIYYHSEGDYETVQKVKERLKDYKFVIELKPTSEFPILQPSIPGL